MEEVPSEQQTAETQSKVENITEKQAVAKKVFTMTNELRERVNSGNTNPNPLPTSLNQWPRMQRRLITLDMIAANLHKASTNSETSIVLLPTSEIGAEEWSDVTTVTTMLENELTSNMRDENPVRNGPITITTSRGQIHDVNEIQGWEIVKTRIQNGSSVSEGYRLEPRQITPVPQASTTPV